MATIKDYREKERYIRKANQVEEQYGIPHNLLVGLLKTESNLNPQAVNPASGAKGLAQFMKDTAKEYGINPYNPSQSIEAAGKYLANSYKKLGDWDSALKSYNMGLQGILDVKSGKRKLPKETAEYTGKIYKNAKIDIGSQYSTPIADEEIRKANEYFQYQPTTDVKDLPISENSIILADNSEEKDKDLEEVQQQTKEYNFLQEYQNIVAQQEQPKQIEQPVVQEQAPQQNLEDIYNQVSNFVDTPIAQQGEEVKNSNKWSTDWFQNRVIPNERLQELYLEDKPYYLERLKNIPEITKVNTISNDNRLTGQYQSDTNKILITPLAQPSVYTHELDHYSGAFPSAMRTVHDSIVEQNMYKKGDKRLGVNNEYYDYLRNPDEVHARIQVLRKDAGFKPDEKVTQEKLLDYLQNYKGNDENILQIMNLTDDKGLLEMLNYMAVNTIKDNKNYAQQGLSYIDRLKLETQQRQSPSRHREKVKESTNTIRPNTQYTQKELQNIEEYARKYSISTKDASERLYNANQQTQNNQVKTYTPQTTKSRIWEVATHPVTAAGYAVRNEQLPENFSRGEINPHEQAVDIINPFFYADQTGKFVNNVGEGNLTEAGMNALNILPLASEASAIGKSLGKLGKLETSISPELIEGLKTQGFSMKPKFNSEINWGKWNKEIPENTQLMKEYNSIEQTSKANGSWMKNPNGSPFQGTPEQFVQQNSESFKNAFGKTKLIDEYGKPMILHHGHFTDRDFSSFLPPKKTNISSSGYEGDYSFFTPHKSLAEDYAGIGMVDDIPGYNSHVKSVYINSENPLIDARTEFADRDIPKSLRDKHDVIAASLNPNEFSEVAVPYGNNVKSATGNNGMFNMANRNIYKSVVPIVGASYLATQNQDQFQQGGKTIIKDQEGQRKYPNQVTEIQGNSMSTSGYGDIPLYVVPDIGEPKLIQANTGNYSFPNATKFTEYPLTNNEQKFLKYIAKIR